VEYDLMGRGLKAQMKYADKLGAVFSMVIGDNEIETGDIKIKNMKTGEQHELSLDDTFTDKFSDISIAHMFSNVMEDINL
jgi:histidyl-tRNA synthetase